MKRNLRWIVPLLLVPGSYLLFLWLASLLSANNEQLGLVLLSLLMLVLAFVAPFVFLIIAVVRFVRARGESRRARGRFTARERAGIDRSAAEAAAWEAGRRLTASLIDGQEPAEITVWGLTMMQAGERVFQDTTAQYARYYGRNVSYTTGGSMYFGRPAFVLAGLAASAISDSAVKSRAQAEAQAQWREWQTVRVVVTDQRVLCDVGGRWLSFWLRGVAEYYPAPLEWSLVLRFPDAEPLLLRGIDVPGLTALVVRTVDGAAALANHPAIEPLRVSRQDAVES